MSEGPHFSVVGGHRRFPGAASSVAAARRFTAARLDSVPRAICEAVVLMVSELATNAVRHGGSDFQLCVEQRERDILVEVVDSGAGLPTLRTPGSYDSYGRGLRIVDELATSWGVSEQAASKAIWFTIALNAE